MAIPFDTLDYARKLEVAGVPTAQAELQATALGEAFAKAVATPADLAALENRLGGRIDALEARLETVRSELLARIEAVRNELFARIETLKVELSGKIDRLAASIDTMKWMFGFMAALNIGILIRLLMIR